MNDPSNVFEKASEGFHASGGPLLPLLSAVVAVLAALSSLFAHHASIQALDIKNRALHETIQASDQFAYYQTKRVRIGTYNALLLADVPRDPRGRRNLQTAIDHEETSSLAVLADAKKLEDEAAQREDASQKKLRSFETFEIATAAFEISIVLVSITALTRARSPLWTATGLSALGVVVMLVAYVQGH
ncbi:MAG TPA: DUF4337 family protein [Candidatus Baltobacteraceae bacterium]|nr:DUF4337 family protein [Candidatus Baltobacteraceae bacterium]